MTLTLSASPPLGIAQGRLLDSLVIVYAVPTSPPPPRGLCRAACWTAWSSCTQCPPAPSPWGLHRAACWTAWSSCMQCPPASPPLGIAQGRLLDSLVIVYAVPTSPGRCRLINRNVVRFKGGPSSIISKVVRWERKGQERGGSGGRKGGQVV